MAAVEHVIQSPRSAVAREHLCKTGERCDSSDVASPLDAPHSKQEMSESTSCGTALGFLEPELLAAGSSRVRVAVRIRGYPPDAPPPPQTVVLRMLNDETLQLSRPAGFSASAAAAAAAAAAGNYLGSSSGAVRWGTWRNSGACIGGNTPCYLSSQKEWTQEYSFDRVFGPAATQEEVYVKTTQFLLPHVVQDGVHATVFAYGATGAGKTHTMLGTDQQPGIMRRAVQDIFFLLKQLERGGGGGSAPTACTRAARGLHTKQGRCEACLGCAIHQSSTVHVSYLEVYNERIRDLLDPSRVSLEVQEDAGKVRVSNLSEHPVEGPEAALALLAQGNKNRCCAATAANSTSSRSHAIFQLVVKSEWLSKTKGTFAATEAKLSLIDLAGSERASATVNRGHRLQEGCHINQSLLALANCINALHLRQQMERTASAGASGRALKGSVGSSKPEAVSGSGLSMSGPVFVNYRNSKLTHLLKSSLEGHCLVVMIANVHFTASAYAESNNTLKYANRAKNLRVNPASLRGAGLAAAAPAQDKARLLRLVHEQSQQLKEEHEKSLSLEQKLEAVRQENQGLRQELHRKDLQLEKLLRRYQELKKARVQETLDLNPQFAPECFASCEQKAHERMSDKENEGVACLTSSTPQRLSSAFARPETSQACASSVPDASKKAELDGDLAAAQAQRPVGCSGNALESAATSTPLRPCGGATQVRARGEDECRPFQSVDSKRPSRQLRSADQSKTRRSGCPHEADVQSEAHPGEAEAHLRGCPLPPSPSSSSLRRSLRLAGLPERRTYEAQCACCASWRDHKRSSEALRRPDPESSPGHPHQQDSKSEPSNSLRRGVDKSLSSVSSSPLSAARRERKRGASCCDGALFTSAAPAPAASAIPPTSSPEESSELGGPVSSPLLCALRGSLSEGLTFTANPECVQESDRTRERCLRKAGTRSGEERGVSRRVAPEADASAHQASKNCAEAADTVPRRGGYLPRGGKGGNRGAGELSGSKTTGLSARGQAPISTAAGAPCRSSSLSSRGGRPGPLLRAKEPSRRCRVDALLKETAKGTASRSGVEGECRHEARGADRRRGSSSVWRGEATRHWRAPGEERLAAADVVERIADPEGSEKDKASLHSSTSSGLEVEKSCREQAALRSGFGWDAREKKRRRTRDLSADCSATQDLSVRGPQSAKTDGVSRSRSKRVPGGGTVAAGPTSSCLRSEIQAGEVSPLTRPFESLPRDKGLPEPTASEVSITREPSVVSDTWSFASESSFTKPVQSRRSLCEGESGLSAEASSAEEGPPAVAGERAPHSGQRLLHVCRAAGVKSRLDTAVLRRPNRPADSGRRLGAGNSTSFCSSSDPSEAFRGERRPGSGRIKRADAAECSTLPTSSHLGSDVVRGPVKDGGDRRISAPGDEAKRVKPSGLRESFGCLSSRTTLQNVTATSTGKDARTGS
ncbi:putative kinesin motor domain-containing protein [Neospora caninum Liverpool]|uniref:Kinesin motor domain-containing protein,putative n=1 Tax=Neospora caninum (strain Liverpool) TaxID=572307 RepID=F0VQT9_NEOCL|nr:putative kinesin motor domain-containing protein [Neospora caninum Liverpool]CBZ56086.1 putative kinesin motor domain-containing protein [Neospora caninum Liverpool]CEL70836.1 TPA: kinesin motor domain-containing protein,putative [Neospora caninum Liverpool]|eukprot:XP_003886112.1 putative kinesin motor domain-containing protein [Neospora caninum Liverpool]